MLPDRALIRPSNFIDWHGAVMRARLAVALACLSLFPAPMDAASAAPGVADEPCPRAAIEVEPGASIQATVDRSGESAAFCLKNGTHRMQVVRPKAGQSFHGEGRTVLNGSRLLTTFSREGRYWVATGQEQHGRRNGRCAKASSACDRPEAVFIDDQPLSQVLSKESVAAGRFYFDHLGGRIYVADDPTGRKVEATVAAFAFESVAPNVVIRNLTVEKYSSVAEKGAIQGRGAAGWTIENCEVRFNSGAGIGMGSDGRVQGCAVHHNGQIGIVGRGQDLLIENNRIWANNTRDFDFTWEAGGVKIVVSAGVVFRGNHVHDNVGPGLWCDINCRDVVYEGNVVEHNHDAGIFHEISYQAAIRRNVVRHNGFGHRKWFWGPDVLVAASQDVEVYDNTLTVSAGGCGIMLIDQGRDDQVRANRGPVYKTRNNKIHDNETTFEGPPCSGGASDVKPGHENFAIITEGNNVFDRNVYRVPRGAGPARFVWGHAVFDWEGLRAKGVEQNGQLVLY
jgi:hypothetical protein